MSTSARPAGEFAGKRVFVSGAASGIGRATAVAFGAQGAHVTVADLDPGGAAATVALVRAAGGSGQPVVCDVSDDASVRVAVAVAVADAGTLDVAVNCAGVSGPPTVPLMQYDLDLLDRMLAVNLRGLFLCMRAQLGYMVPAGLGAIVNVASAAGLIAASGAAGYVASKHGAVGLTKAAALDYAAMGVRINAVCPGLVDTPMIAGRPPEVRGALALAHPIGRIARPEEIADAILWLSSSRAAFVTGTAVPVDGGYTAR
jgi:NAD(P)-dependent dehydrogenase (short-subunit alcohol dehydrogenase family)